MSDSAMILKDLELAIEPLAHADQLSFDLFKLNEAVGRDKTLIILSSHILKEHDLIKFVDQDKLFSFLKTISEGYRRDISYHNDLHGSDVA